MPCDLTYMWELINKINSKQNRNKCIDAENILMLTRWEGIWGDQ